MDENKDLETNLPTAPVEDDLAEEDTAAEETGTEEEPVVDTVFGLPRRTFHLVVVGYAVGVILVGLLGLAGLVDEGTGTVVPGVVCAGVGYLIAKRLDKRDAEKQDADGAPK